MRNRLSRRDFLKGTLAASATLASMSLLGCADASTGNGTTAEEKAAETTAAPENDKVVASYDEEYDVVVIGHGFAGAAAAITAAQEGAQVLMLEKAPETAAGGNSRVCGQQILAPTDVERAISYFDKIFEGYDYDKDLLRVTVEGMAQLGDWLKETFDPNMDLQDLMYPEFPEVEGSDTMRCYLIDGERTVGKLLNIMKGKLAEMTDQIHIYYESPAKELIQDAETKMIMGVLIEKEGQKLRIKANNGVVMACGGYENNQKMIQNYFHFKYAYPKGSTYNTGDGIYMATKVNADLWHLNNPSGPDLNFKDPNSDVYYGYSLSMTFGSKSTIYVGPNGTRFINESLMTRHGKHNIHGSWQTVPTVLPAYAIFDEAVFTAGPINSVAWSEDNTAELAKGWIKKADTLEELAALINVSPENLGKTVARYKFYCDQGEDYEFNRSAATLIPLSEVGPYYAMELTPTLTNTQGGAVRNANCEVVDIDGYAIPHLYSAGEFGSMYVHGYNGGGNVGEALATGRIAGKNAAIRDKSQIPVISTGY
ncbi:MAG: FAD-dependent oxidoreductase [Lachnospiraceae bacterium]|nr:FAD-dependent oxidoreductase [Lachnospiraceae bacterium]